MKTIKDIVKKQKGRLTKIKKVLIDLFEKKECGVSKKDIVLYLNKNKLFPNESTIYRELNFFIDKKIIRRFRIVNYEFYEKFDYCHEHFLCLNCKTLSPLKLHNYIKKFQSNIEKKSNIKIFSHDINFYGYCKNCYKLI